MRSPRVPVELLHAGRRTLDPRSAVAICGRHRRMQYLSNWSPPAGYNSRSTGERVEVVVEMVNTAKQEARRSKEIGHVAGCVALRTG